MALFSFFFIAVRTRYDVALLKLTRAAQMRNKSVGA